MKSIELIFVHPDTITSDVISLFTLCKWSHVAVADGDHIVDSMKGEGVRRRTRASFDAAFPRTQQKNLFVTVSDAGYEAAMQWLDGQIGKGYDTWALLGFLVPQRDWQDDDKWFCSELAASALVQAGYSIPVPSTSTVSPAKLIKIVESKALDLIPLTVI